MGFLILRPLSPETGYHFCRGGGGALGGEEGGSKVCAQKGLNEGQVEQSWPPTRSMAIVCITPRPLAVLVPTGPPFA